MRKSRARPKSGWSLRELAELSGVGARSIRHYLQLGLLPASAFKGTATRYQRPHLVWLLAIRRVRLSEGGTLDAIRRRLAALSELELEAFATEGVQPGKLADALGIQRAAPGRAPVPTAGSAPAPASAAALDARLGSELSLHAPRWVRIELALGLELHVRADASERVLELARRLNELAVAGARDEAGASSGGS